MQKSQPKPVSGAPLQASTGDNSTKIPLTTLAPLAMALLFFAISLYVRIRLLAAPLERDEGGFAYIAQQMLRGVPPYESGYTMKLTGIHAAYALFISLFGETASGVHLGLLVISIMNTVGVYLLARRFLPRETAALSAGFYALLAVSQDVLGVFAHATHFVTAFALAGAVFYFRWLDQGRRGELLLSGICLGLSIVMKQNGAFFALLFLGMLIAVLYRHEAPLHQRLRLLAIWLGGLVAPYLLIIAGMALSGTLAPFWFWTTTYSLDYAGGHSWHDTWHNLRTGFREASRTTYPLWLLATTGVGLFAASRNRHWFPFLLLLVSALSIVPSGYFYRHYFVLVLPALALFAGIALDQLQRLCAARLPRLALPLVLVVAVLVAGTSINAGRAYLFQLPPTKVSIKCYGITLFSDASHVIADYIRQNSNPNERVAILGSEPQIYFYAQRRSASRYIHMYSLTDGGPHSLSMSNAMLEEIMTVRPKFIVISYEFNSWLRDRKDIAWLLEPIAPFFDRHYRVVGRIDLLPWRVMYKWGTDATQNQSSPKQQIYLLQRSD